MEVKGVNINNPSTVTLDIEAIPASDIQNSNNCASVSLPNSGRVTASNPPGAGFAYNWQDSDTIVRTDGSSSWTFVNSGHTNTAGQTIFPKSSEGGKSCQDTMLVSADNTSETLWVLDKSQPDGGVSLSDAQAQLLGISSGQGCYVLYQH